VAVAVPLLAHPRRLGLPFAALAFLTCLAALAPAPARANLFAYEAEFGSAGTGTDRFAAPAGVATDEAGRVYVADTAAGRVEIYDNATDGNRYLGVLGAGEVRAPVGIFIDVRSRVYVADGARHTVLQYDPWIDGGALRREYGRALTPGPELGKLAGPRFVVVDRRARVYVTERDNVRVQWFRPTRNNRAKAIAGFGTAEPAPFDQPEGLAQDVAGRFYVSNQSADGGAVRVYDPRGALIRTLAGPGSGLGQLSSPRGLLRDPFGRLLVADAGNARVQAFAPFEAGGAALEAFGRRGTGPGDFSAPSALALAPGALLYVVDAGAGRVVRLRYDDADRDGALDGRDTCQGVVNGDQRDSDRDGLGDDCDGDDDNDGLVDAADGCPRTRRGQDVNGDGCGDPRSRISVPRERRTYARRLAPDRVAGTAQADVLGVDGVDVAVARLVGRRCAWYVKGRFSVRARCDAPAFFAAQGQRRWSARVRVRARGTYRVLSRARQVGGLLESRTDRSNRRTFRIR
jgi:DNA-binding beta-propeller fold protein YncE